MQQPVSQSSGIATYLKWFTAIVTTFVIGSIVLCAVGFVGSAFVVAMTQIAQGK